MPYVFEVPSTLDALHDMIGMYSSTGADACLLIQRVHKSNSVRLNRTNSEKMQNFYDILMRRFIAIGDAIYENGDGGVVQRYVQLDSLASTLFEMAQDSAEGAAATWSRRLGFMQSAHQKRIRDSSFEQDEDFTAWPSLGTFLALRLVGHIFPVTDKRHCITTPTILFLGQILTHTPVLSKRDLVMGLMCSGLLLEYVKRAKRIAPEANAFLAGMLRVLGRASGGPLPTLENAQLIIGSSYEHTSIPDANEKLPMEKADMDSSNLINTLLRTTLTLIEHSIDNLSGCIDDTETEVFAGFSEALLASDVKRFPKAARKVVASIVAKLQVPQRRLPLQRQMAIKKGLKTMVPRIENTSVGRKNTKTEADRLRRELKREQKSTKRDIRLDASVVESERRQKATSQREREQNKRHKAYAWLEQEQATINDQVRQGGGLLRGGGMGAAKAKAKSAKLGVKKGGKL